MKNPATTWPTAVPTSVARDRGLHLLDVAVELRVRDAQRPGAKPLPDLPEARDHRVGEVARPLRDLLADEGEQQCERAEAEEHHHAGRETARHPDPAQPDDGGTGQRGEEERDGDRQGDDREEAQAPQQAEHRDRDDDEPPRPGGSEVEAPRHLGAAEVGGAGGECRSGPALGTTLGPLGDDALGEPVLLAGEGGEQPPASRLHLAVARGVDRGPALLAHVGHATDPPRS
jgi:hypothetical protein